MKVIILFFSTVLFIKGYSQEYSDQKVNILIDSLTSISTKFDHISVISMDDDIPITQKDTVYFVYDNWTGLNIYRNTKYVDNDIHKLFLKIARKGTNQDFIKMTKSQYSNIRVYGYWALKKNKSKEIDSVLSILNNDKGMVKFVTVGDIILFYEVKEIIKKLN